MKDVYLKIEEKNTKIASNNSKNFIVNVDKNGTKVNNKTILFKTNFTKEGFNFSNKTVFTKKEIGAKAVANINYIGREKANESVENEEYSNSYNLEKKLTKEELEDIKNELKEGVGAMRRDVISLDFDKELSNKEQLEIIREAYKKFEEDTNKRPSNIIINLHTNTEHKHAHVLVVGEEKDVSLNRQQLQHFKLILANKTAEVLENKGLKNSLENYIKREEKGLERLELYAKTKEIINKIEKEINEKNEEKFKDFAKNLNFTKEDLDNFKEKQKIEGYKHFINNNTKLTIEEKAKKWEKAEKWEDKFNAKIDENFAEKFKDFKEELKLYNNKNNLNNDFRETQKVVIAATGAKISIKDLKEIKMEKALTLAIEVKEKIELTISKDLEEKFKTFTKDLNFTKADLLIIEEKNKVEGYKNYLYKAKENLEKEILENKNGVEIWEKDYREKLGEKLEEKMEELNKKIEKAEKWEDKVNKKIDENLEERTQILKQKIEEFGEKNLTIDKALALKNEEIEDKTLSLEQQIDKKIDGKLDNKTYSFQH
ncbi:hypothetical protein [Aliarcobacter butzleri]|uniref:hypothetical protein n=1 Tax=Aliarcobacter butzleri TaxID=28197 RepID=UPI0012605582|nr:hypothetical protein [Aliarcobacter butzleri]